jgi:hypothetical protein
MVITNLKILFECFDLKEVMLLSITNSKYYSLSFVLFQMANILRFF